MDERNEKKKKRKKEKKQKTQKDENHLLNERFLRRIEKMIEKTRTTEQIVIREEGTKNAGAIFHQSTFSFLY